MAIALPTAERCARTRREPPARLGSNLQVHTHQTLRSGRCGRHWAHDIGGDFSDVIVPYDAYELNQRLQFGHPNLAHWLGTDEFGRDVPTRLIYGARIALFIGLASSFVGATAGAVGGLINAYLGGRTDLWLQRLMHIMLAFPLLILALAIVTVLGRSIPNLIVAIAIPVIPRTARVVRSSALAVKENVFVEAARAVGSSHIRVMFRHLVPNIMAPYLIVLTAQLGGAILTEASLSFLGLGTAEPTPSWGLMLSGGAPMYAEKAPWLASSPVWPSAWRSSGSTSLVIRYVMPWIRVSGTARNEEKGDERFADGCTIACSHTAREPVGRACGSGAGEATFWGDATGRPGG